MYIFTLVDDVKSVLDTFRREHGEFTLAMLYNSTLEAGSNWNLIVSSPWTDRMLPGDAIKLIARAVNEGLSQENKAAISRITVLKTSDPFVRDMTRLYAGVDVPVLQVTAGDVTEGSGFILYSQNAA